MVSKSKKTTKTTRPAKRTRASSAVLTLAAQLRTLAEEQYKLKQEVKQLTSALNVSEYSRAQLYRLTKEMSSLLTPAQRDVAEATYPQEQPLQAHLKYAVAYFGLLVEGRVPLQTHAQYPTL